MSEPLETEATLILENENINCALTGWPVEGRAHVVFFDDARGDAVYSDDAFHALFEECADCGEYFLKGDGHSDEYGTFVCDECYEDNDWNRCEHCDALIREDDDDTVLTEDTEDYYCGSCAADRLYHCDDCGDSDGVYDYSYKPTPRFKRAGADANVEHPLYFGIENEFSFNRWSDRDEGIEAFRDAFSEDDFYLKHDSSLEKGVEMVSHPRTLASWHELLPRMEDFFDEMRSLCIDGHDGLHVHISRKGMTPSHIVRFGSFIAAEQDNVTVIARRSSERWARYHDKPKTGDDARACGRADTRYSAVNWQNRSTVEVRVFRSTTSIVDFYAAIEFCHAAYAFTKYAVNLQQILSGGSWPMFLSFIRENKDRYSHLIELWDSHFRSDDNTRLAA